MSGGGNGPALWIDPTFGAAGDMLLGALLGLGAELDPIREALGTLDPLRNEPGWAIDRAPVTRNSLSATRARITHGESHHHRTWSSIDTALAGADDLPDRVRNGARATFRLLGEVEAEMHGVDIDEVHFHEVGAVDAIVDIVGCWLALYQLDPSLVVTGPVGLGHGTVVAAHGALPLPAPATARLLAGAPVHPLDIEAETVTPTGAALLAAMTDRWGPLPAGTLVATGRGAGGRDPDGHPNVVTAHLLDRSTTTAADTPIRTAAATAEETAGDPPPGDPRAERTTAVVLETNLDDVTPELIGHLIGRCLDTGADDAWAQPIVMKKSRPGFLFRILAAPPRVAELQALLFAETGTLGVRCTVVAKDVLPRRTETVEVDGMAIRVKVGPYGAKAEYDDLAEASRRSGLPIRALAARALDRLTMGPPGDGAE